MTLHFENFKRLILVFIITFSLILPIEASYFVTLKDNKFDPGKGKSILTMFVTNEANTIKAIELVPKKRDLSPNGQEINSETEDIIIIPSQIILPAKSEKAVSIRWVGSNVIRQELSYRINIDEISVGKKQAENTKMIETKLRFIKSIYVAPKIVKESIKLLRGNRVIAKDGSSRLQLKVLNNGTVHTILHNFSLEYNTVGKKIDSTTINMSDIEPFKGSVNILPGRSIEGWIPWPENISESVERFNLLSFNAEDSPEIEDN
jgi:P pilus assembly chaperone PapD